MIFQENELNLIFIFNLNKGIVLSLNFLSVYETFIF
jgi:hypothetical protein